MNKVFITFLFLLTSITGFSQIYCTADANSGSGYDAITNQGLDYESPDCEHTDFGAHLTQAFDSILQKNVFLFHSHIDDDNDRCIVFDRVRMEIKGGPNTDPESQHIINEQSFYRWKFQVGENYLGGSSFHHIFQLKAKGGPEDSFPVLTLTLRTDELEFQHNGGDDGITLGQFAAVDLDLVKGRWIEAFLYLNHQESAGTVEIILKDLFSGDILMDYTNSNVDLWRTNAEYNRPKWGMYRSKSTGLVDEVFQFADFCISETAANLCPADNTLLTDNVAPSAPTNLTASNISMTSVDLTWTESTDLFGVTEYDVIQDGLVVQSVPNLMASVNNLSSGTTYNFTIIAKDAAGNGSPSSNTVVVTTDPADTLPDAVSNPFPLDEASYVNLSANLSWATGNNTDNFLVYFGTESNPPLVNTQTTASYQPTLMASTTYFWRIEASNVNGETSSPIWSFTTGLANLDEPWLVYRANERLDVETNFLMGLDIPIMPTLDEIENDPNGSTNKFYNYRHEEIEKFRWRHQFNPTDTAITVVARLKALNADVNCICYFEVKAFGWREKLRLNQSTVKLERTEPNVEEDIPFEFKDAFHLIRVTMKGNEMRVYLDENPVAMAIGNSSDENTNSLFEFGKSGSGDCGASIDWIAILNNEANAPNEGLSLPSDLFLSSDDKLSNLEIDGITIPNFNPNTFDYTVDIKESTSIPIVTYTTSSGLATTTLTNPTTVPNTSATIEVLAQDGWTNSTYTINYVSWAVYVNTLNKAGVNIYPNPAKDEIFIESEFNDLESIDILSLTGKRIYQNQHANNHRINTAAFSPGMYFIIIEKKDGQRLTQKIIIE